MRTNAAWQTKLMHFARKLKCYRAHKHSETVPGDYAQEYSGSMTL